jgi:hypothetical protein
MYKLKANAKAVFAQLLAAKLSGQTVQVDGSNTIPSGFPACVVQFVKLKYLRSHWGAR